MAHEYTGYDPYQEKVWKEEEEARREESRRLATELAQAKADLAEARRQTNLHNLATVAALKESERLRALGTTPPTAPVTPAPLSATERERLLSLTDEGRKLLRREKGR